MTARLNQVIAIEKGVKAQAYGRVGEFYKVAQKSDLFNGFSKVYEKIDDASEDLPPERKVVQFSVASLLRDVRREMTTMFTVEARKDWTNTIAKGDVIVDGTALFEGAPVSFLLFLEKQLTDLRTFIGSLPVLDAAETWTLDLNSGLQRSDTTKTHRTKKVQRPIVLYDATAEHPAQTQLITEDVLAGHWAQTKHSGALPAPRKQVLSDRVEKLLLAVKTAREQANMQEEILSPSVGDAVFEYLLAD